MIVSDFIVDTWLAYRGKGSDKAPAVGTQKATNLLAIANRKIGEWAEDPYVDWISTSRTDTTDDAISASLTYALEDDVFRLSKGKNKWVVVTAPDGREIKFKAGKGVALQGINPRNLVFDEALPEDFYGGTIQVPVQILPARLSLGTDKIPVDNPAWLAYITASELARNDPAKDDQFGNLVGLANSEYTKMVNNNQAAGYGESESVGYDVPQVG